MDRARAAALLVATVVGVGGGVTVALDVAPGADAPRGDAPAAPAEQPSDDQTAEPNEPLLVYAGGELRDGEETVGFEPTGSLAALVRRQAPTALTRRDGGYLLAVGGGGAEGGDGEDLWSVDRDGSETRIGTVAPGWDLNLQGTRVVGHDLEEDLLTIWDTATGEPVARWDGDFDARDSAAYAGSEDRVLVSVRVDTTSYELRRWDVAPGETTTAVLSGYAGMVVSPGGYYVAGSVGQDGQGSDDEAFCAQLHQTYLSAQDVFWQTCDWNIGAGPASFSPDGTRLLVVPSATEGLGPAELAVIDANVGPDPLVARFDAPDNAGPATWADNESVYVQVLDYDEGRPVPSVQRCTLEGECDRVLGPVAGPLVVGEVR